MEIKVIGIGGVGTILCDNLCKFLNYSKDSYNVTLIDGDEFESKNNERQSFITWGNKARSKISEFRGVYRALSFLDIQSYVSPDNVEFLILENDIVFLCVDNHITRKVVSDHCRTLNDVTLISGGNEFTDGNVQIYIRKGGEDVTASLTDYHPEISSAIDNSPEDMSCQELEKSEPQLLFTNMTVATLMCSAFYAIHVEGRNPVDFAEVYFDILSVSVLPKIRKPRKTA